jgi:hypothetical protein
LQIPGLAFDPLQFELRNIILSTTARHACSPFWPENEIGTDALTESSGVEHLDEVHRCERRPLPSDRTQRTPGKSIEESSNAVDPGGILMSILCNVVSDDERDLDQFAFVVVPRVGEYIDLGDGAEPNRITRVLHKAGGELGEASIRLDVTQQML